MKRKGFTLTELLIVMAIIAIISSIAAPSISSISKQSRLTADKTTAEAIETSIYEWMSTDYYADTFYSGNMYTSINSGVIGNARLDGRTEQLYSYEFAGTSQLPGVEFADEQQIRHAAIVAIKATSAMKITVKNNEQFIDVPKTSADYGFKYYYKIGRVNPEKVDSAESALGEDEVYKYYVWLDRQGGNVDPNITPKRVKNQESYLSASETMYSFVFDYGSRNINDLKVEISCQEMLYSFEALIETPLIFKPDVYDIRLYENGDLCAEKMDISFTGTEVITFKKNRMPD